jgi:hypothetical protein
MLKIPWNKKELLALGCVAFIGVLAIMAGQMIKTIGSREIAKPITMELSSVDGQDIGSAHVFFKLARSGTVGELIKSKTNGQQWHYENVFIENLFVSVSDSDVGKIKELQINIGDKQMVFAGSDIAGGWKENDASSIKHFLSAQELNSTRFFEAPTDVKRPTSLLPLPIFKQIINWGGDIEFFATPAKRSAMPVAAFLIVLVTIATIIKRHGADSSLPLDEIRGYLEIVYTVTSTVLVALFVALLTLFVYEPNTTALYQSVNEVFIKTAVSAFAPESREQLLVVTFIPLSAPVIFCLYFFWRNVLRKLKEDTLRWLHEITATLVPAVLFAFAYVGLALADFVYLSGSVLRDSLGKYVFIIVLFPILFYFFFARQDVMKSLQYPIRVAGNALLAITFVVIFTTTLQSIHAPTDDFHLNPILYPISQLVAGKFLLIDVPSIYGLYPMFIAPIVKIFDFSLWSISAMFASLICLSYLSLFLFMRKAVMNPVLLYSGLFAVLLYSYFAVTIHLGDFPYYQYWPIRLLIPTLFLALIAKFLHHEDRYAYIALLATVSVGLLWNLDSGIIVLLSFIAVLIYHELSKDNSWSERGWRIATDVLATFGLAALSLATFSLYTYIQSGTTPPLSALIEYQKMFAAGYFMIPMPPPLHIWASLIVVYLIGLTLSARALILKKITYRDKLMTVVSILGLGLFTYYSGRSHDYSLFGPSFPALVLVAIFGDTLLARLEKLRKPVLGDSLLFAFVFFILIAAPVSLILNTPMYAKEARAGVARIFTEAETIHSQNIDFIRDHTVPGGQTLILAQNADGLYYGESQTRAAVDLPSTTDLFMLEEVEIIIDFLSDNTTTPVFTMGSRSWLDKLDPRVNSLINDKYTAVGSSESGSVMFMPAAVVND